MTEPRRRYVDGCDDYAGSVVNTGGGVVVSGQEVEALIAEARANVERATDSMPPGRARQGMLAGRGADESLSLIVRMADALEAAHATTEYEYGVAVVDDTTTATVYQEQEGAERHVAEWNRHARRMRTTEAVVVRRIPASPWEVVTDERH